MLFKERIQVTFVYWKAGQGLNLFQYNSQPSLTALHFSSTVLNLPLSEKTVYYHFHHCTHKTQQLSEFVPEKRRLPISNLEKSDWANWDTRLIGSIRFSRQIDQNGVRVLYAEALSASAIQLEQSNGELEEAEMREPYAVTRSFKGGYPLRTGQLLRIGQAQFRIIEVNTKSKGEIDCSLYERRMLNIDVNNNNTVVGSSLYCRLCLSKKQIGQNILISPCDCTGIRSCIHLQCLKLQMQWKLKDIHDFDGTFYQTKHLSCRFCHQQYPIAIIKKCKTYSMLDFLQRQRPYLSLVPNNTEEQEDLSFISFKDSNQFEIGSSSENRMVLQDDTVSLKHAVLRCDGDEIVVMDRESKYGTLVQENGMRFQLGRNFKAIQIGNIVVSLKTIYV